MIFKIAKTNGKGPLQTSDVSRYLRYCFSPKPADPEYTSGERIAETHLDSLFPGPLTAGKEDVLAETLAADLENWAISQRANKTSTNYLHLIGTLSFHPSDKVTPEQAIERAREAVSRVMPGQRPGAFVCHTDSEHTHVHFVVSNVAEGGKIYAPSGRSWSGWELEAERQEIEYGYTRVMQRVACAATDKNREVLVNAPTSAELALVVRTGKPTAQMLAKSVIDKILKSKPQTIIAFADAIELVDGYEFLPAGKTGKCQVWSIRCPDGIVIKGSDFGKLYSFGGLEKHHGVTYEQARDSEAISIRRSRQTNIEFGENSRHAEREDAGRVGGSAGAASYIDGDAGRSIDGGIRSDDASDGVSESSSSITEGGGRGIDDDIKATTGARKYGREGRVLDIDHDSASDSDHHSSIDNISVLSARQDARHSSVQSIDISNAREKRDRTTEQIERFLAAFEAAGIVNFEIGSITPKGSIIRGKAKEHRYTLDVAKKSETIAYLKRENLLGQDIYFRPCVQYKDAPLSSPGIVMLDDLDGEKLARVKRELNPITIVETSPGNWQAWIKFGTDTTKEIGTQWAKILAADYGADPAAADWRHYGRMPGFTNRKLKHKKRDGKQPFCALISTSAAREMPAIEQLRKHVNAKTLEKEAERNAMAITNFNSAFTGSDCDKAYMICQQKLLQEYQTPDWSRLDFMTCCDLIRRGFNRDDIERALIHHSPVERKSNASDYTRRTVSASAATVEKERKMNLQQNRFNANINYER